MMQAKVLQINWQSARGRDGQQARQEGEFGDEREKRRKFLIN